MSDTAKYTAGPWHTGDFYPKDHDTEWTAEIDRFPKNGVTVCQPIDANGKTIALVVWEGMSDVEGEATAYVMGAGPELLSAAKCALGHLTGNMDGDMDLGDPVSMLREAIAKAEGRSHD